MRVRVSIELPLSPRPEPVRSEATSLFEEAFRTLRSNLLLRMRQGDKAFLVTSARPGEGKSTIVVNLAHVIAAGNRKVLLVDADLRRPRLHELFSLRNRQGLTDLLTGGVAPKVVYQRIENGLTVLTSGPLARDPQELLLGGNLESIVSQFKSDFDVVLFDSAPVLAFADTTLLAPKMDGLILALKSGEVTTTEAMVVRERLQSVRARLVGCVLTYVPQQHMQPYHPYASEYVKDAAPVARADSQSTRTLTPAQEAKS
jgi:capsular exopolysaccharide synthesis family protein